MTKLHYSHPGDTFEYVQTHISSIKPKELDKLKLGFALYLIAYKVIYKAYDEEEKKYFIDFLSKAKGSVSDQSLMRALRLF